MARRWHVAANNRQNGHQEHGRGTQIVLRYMKDRGGFFVFILTCGELPKSHSKKMQIVRAGFDVPRFACYVASFVVSSNRLRANATRLGCEAWPGVHGAVKLRSDPM